MGPSFNGAPIVTSRNDNGINPIHNALVMRCRPIGISRRKGPRLDYSIYDLPAWILLKAHHITAVHDQVDDQHRADSSVFQRSHLDITRAAAELNEYRIAVGGEIEQIGFMAHDCGPCSSKIRHVEHLDLTNHLWLGAAGAEATALPRKFRHKTGASDHRWLLNDHRHKHITPIHLKIDRDTQRHAKHPDDILSGVIRIGE